jgi:hypothetical protein
MVVSSAPQSMQCVRHVTSHTFEYVVPVCGPAFTASNVTPSCSRRKPGGGRTAGCQGSGDRCRVSPSCQPCGCPFSARHGKDDLTALAMHPGLVRTSMGSLDAPLDIDTSVRGLTKVEARWGSGGQAFGDYRNEIIPW